MEEGQAKLLFAELAATPDGWRVTLPDCAFLQRPVDLVLQTLPVPRPAVPQPNEVMKSLAAHLVANLSTVIARAEQAFAAHLGSDFPTYAPRIRNPHLWLYVETLEDDGPSRWTFVVEQIDNPDYGTHIEFDDLLVIDVWGGD